MHYFYLKWNFRADENNPQNKGRWTLSASEQESDKKGYICQYKGGCIYCYIYSWGHFNRLVVLVIQKSRVKVATCHIEIFFCLCAIALKTPLTFAFWMNFVQENGKKQSHD